MKLAVMIDSLMGAAGSLSIPLPYVKSTTQAEEQLRAIEEVCPQFTFTLIISGGQWVLVASRRPGIRVCHG